MTIYLDSANLEHIKEIFCRFLNNTREQGCIFFCQDDLALTGIVRSLNKGLFSYGLSPEAQLSARDVRTLANRTYFRCIHQGEDLGEIALQIPGCHNISNALAAIAVGLKINLEFREVQDALVSYTGVRRRLELKFNQNFLHKKL